MKNETRKTKRAAYRTHAEATIEGFRGNPKFAAAYLNAILKDGDQRELMLALRYMSAAFGGIHQVAGKARLNSTALYRTLSPKGNPEFKSLAGVLKAMGMRLSVEPLK